jgi:hypothetical protein
MKKHRYSNEFKVAAVKLASHPDIETQDVAAISGPPGLRLIKGSMMKSSRASGQVTAPPGSDFSGG